MPKNVVIPVRAGERALSERERDILRTVIHLYILNAAPVGSRNLSKYLENDLKLSPATMRNVMSDLEEMELISHPHTSAGRVPTDKGYRYYVDSLMQIEALSEREIAAVHDTLTGTKSDTILRDASRVLGMLSHYLGVVEIPHISDLILLRIELISLSSTRLLVVLALDSNIVRTVTLEAEFELDYKNLEEISSYINEKVSGKPLNFLRSNFFEMLGDYDMKDAPLVRLFVESVDKIFERQKTVDRIHIAGAQNLLKNPEFEDLDKVKGIIELIENEDIIIHLFDKYEDSEGVKILIGSEMQNEYFEAYSMIVSSYKIGSASGSIGLIGPKRMKYSKMVSLVEHVSELISQSAS